jgi:hypothetical protein
LNPIQLLKLRTALKATPAKTKTRNERQTTLRTKEVEEPISPWKCYFPKRLKPSYSKEQPEQWLFRKLSRQHCYYPAICRYARSVLSNSFESSIITEQ